MSFYCQACKEFDEERDIRTHRCAINAKKDAINDAINAEGIRAKVSARSANVKKPVSVAQGSGVGAAVVHEVRQEAVVEVGASRTANRRSREDYNAYMRGYMKQRRAGVTKI